MGYFLLPHFTTTFMIVFLSHEHRHIYLSPEGHLKPLDYSTQFCTLCNSTVIRALEKEMSESSQGYRGSHHWTRNSLAASVKTGCRICSTVWEHRRGLKRDFLGFIMFWRPTTSWDTSILGFTIISEEARGEYTNARCSFKLVSLESSDIPSHPISDNTGSDASLQQAASWFLDCRMNHIHCRNRGLTNAAFSPTRLLFLQQEGEGIRIQLRCSTGQLPAVPYMTLSHCWGGGSPLQLVKVTLSAFQQNIDASQLPKTFLQATQMAKYLGCSYLWIDSLCIIQDDWDDWLHEAALMGQVYKNSICNIAATDATDGSKGCFFIRNPRAIQLEPFQGNLGQTSYLINDSDVFRHHVLYTRGWVLQEVLLAPRVLHCCREQLYWHCDELRASEVFPNGMPASVSEDYHPVTKYRSFNSYGKRSILTSSTLENIASKVPYYAGSLATPRWIEFPRAYSADLDLNRSGFEVLGKDVDLSLRDMSRYLDLLSGHVELSVRWKLRATHPFTYWARLVQAYCSMSFTRTEDRAAAFSGIISLLRPHLGEYLVGLWEIFLPFELLWVAVRPSNRQKIFRGPSWSWMSIDGPVEYSRCGHSVEHDQLLVRFVSASVDYTSTDMSRASNWEMRLWGKLAVGDYKHRGNRPSKRVHMHYIGNPTGRILPSGAPEVDPTELLLESDTPSPPYIFLDEVEPVELYDREFVFFLLFRDQVVGSKIQAGLVLRLTEDEQRFRRIGVFDGANPNVQAVFDAVEPREVVLV